MWREQALESGLLLALLAAWLVVLVAQLVSAIPA
jgi:hypothetical protein